MHAMIVFDRSWLLKTWWYGNKDGIWIDHLKISTILDLPAPTNLLELQSLQGKENLLHYFVCNFPEKTHGYMHLLKKNTPFFSDD